MSNYTVTQLISCLTKIPFEIRGEMTGKSIDQLSVPQAANEHSLIWVSGARSDKESLVQSSQAAVVICDASLNTDLFPSKCFIVVENPKLAFLRIGNTFFKQPVQYEIHPTAIIHPEAKIAKNVYIGPYTIIGKCEIGEGSIIHGACYLYDNVTLGRHVTLHAGCKIGAEGLGHLMNEDGMLENFPHVGGIFLEDRVEIGVNSTIAKGALSLTKIGKNTKIDCQVQIGHNVEIGENTIIAANVVIGGSSYIGHRVFIGIGATIIDYIKVQDEVQVGAGVVVVENIQTRARVLARPPIILP